MKRKLFLLAAVMFCLSPVLAQNKTSITVVDNGGVNEPKVLVQIFDTETRKSVKKDTMTFNSNKFVIDVNLEHLGYIQLRSLQSKTKVIPGSYVFPNTQLTLTCEPKNTIADGSQVYKDMTNAEKEIKPYTDLLQAFNEKIENAGDKADSLEKALTPEAEKVEAEMQTAALNYIKANPDNDGSAYLVSYCKDPESAVSLLSDKVKNGMMKSIYEPILKQIKQEKERKAQSVNVADGKLAPDFTLKDINGKALSLSSLKGKYVVIDFWGSWCIWCVRGIPKMKEMYAKYKPTGKFEILSVDCNDTDAKWREAVKKYEMPWKHVYNPKESKLLTTYAIEGFPTKVVVDPKGTIVKTVVGEDPAFYEYINTLFK